jgi:hypothetical protein
MKATVLLVALVAVSSIHASELEEWVHQELFGKYPTKTTSITLVTEEGLIEDYGELTELMESKIHRKLQTPQEGAGFGNEPVCSSDGVYFTCEAPNVFTAGENITQVKNTIQCLLNDQVTTDFQMSENCTCNAYLEQPIVNTSGIRQRNCACGVCPKGSSQAVSLDCSVVTDDPFIVGQCETIDCEGRCNGGASVVNAPTVSPATEGGSPSPASAAPIAPQTTAMASAVFGTLLSSLVWIIV